VVHSYLRASQLPKRFAAAIRQPDASVFAADFKEPEIKQLSHDLMVK